MRNILGYLFMVCFFSACQSSTSDNDEIPKKEDTAQISASIRSNMSFLNDLNAIEGVFGNENWLIVDNKDSSYLYFSRLGNFTFDTYYYKRVHGDSSNVEHRSIQKEKNDLTWTFQGHKLVVAAASIAMVSWKEAGIDSAKYQFVRINDHAIELSYPNGKKLTLQKTLPFSLFLVRSRYDYAHGTHLAFDSTRFNRKK